MNDMEKKTLLEKICNFYWYELSMKGNKVDIINLSNKDFNRSFCSVEEGLKHFIDTMKDTNSNPSNVFVWSNEVIEYIDNL